MGYLLYKHELTRRLIVPRILAQIFATGPSKDRELLAELSAMLKQEDAFWRDFIRKTGIRAE